jgi:hypothetical protein
MAAATSTTGSSPAVIEIGPLLGVSNDIDLLSSGTERGNWAGDTYPRLFVHIET